MSINIILTVPDLGSRLLVQRGTRINYLRRTFMSERFILPVPDPGSRLPVQKGTWSRWSHGTLCPKINIVPDPGSYKLPVPRGTRINYMRGTFMSERLILTVPDPGSRLPVQRGTWSRWSHAAHSDQLIADSAVTNKISIDRLTAATGNYKSGQFGQVIRFDRNHRQYPVHWSKNSDEKNLQMTD
jgi:hypothetical protein